VRYEDMALFRIQKKTVFYSDLKVYIKEFKAFRCLQKNSRILSNLKLDSKSIGNIPRLRSNYKSIKKNGEFVYSLIKLIKMQIFSSRYNVSVSSKMLENIKTRRCGVAKFSTWSNELKSLFQMELYILERFPIKTNTEDLELNLFIKSVNDKVKHATYF
jgi:hypothetical protein